MSGFTGRIGSRRVVRALFLPTMMLVALASAATAQEPLGRPTGDEWGRQMIRIMALGRTELGVVLGSAEEVNGRTGVLVMQALPGRPAAKAGIEPGDILLAIDDQDLGTDPGRRVTDVVRRAEPGDTLVVLLHRDGREHAVHVVMDRRRALTIPPIPDFRPAIAEALREIPALVGQLGRHRLELAEMNPELGRYFGVQEGILVVNIAEASPLGLVPGDVVLSIDGRNPHDPAHLRSILASYRADEEVELVVVRDRQRMTVRGVAAWPR